MRSRARITNGRWQRRVPWQTPAGAWRTDMFKSVLADERLKEAEFICKDGTTIIISAEELRRVLPLGRDHWVDAQIWGPFSIDPLKKTIDGCAVEMSVDAPKA